MEAKTDPKQPIENWRFEVSLNDQDALKLLAASAHGPFKLKDSLTTFATALENGRKCLESNDFVLLEDGTLVAGAPMALLQDYVLVINVTETFNLGSLAGLAKAINARKIREGFNPWHVTGYLKSNPSYSENLVLDACGGFYFHDRRKSWESMESSRLLLRRRVPA